MAHIKSREKKDGTLSWSVQIRNKGSANICRTFPTEHEAIDFVKNQTYSRSDQIYTNFPVSYLLSKYYAYYLNERAKGMTCFQGFWHEHIGSYLINEITPALILRCMEQLKLKLTRLKVPISEETQRKYLIYLGAAFKFGVIKGLVPFNPIKEIGYSHVKSKIKTKKPKFLALKNSLVNRILAHMSIAELREKCGLSKESLRCFLHPNRNTSLSQMEKVLNACGLEYTIFVRPKNDNQ